MQTTLFILTLWAYFAASVLFFVRLASSRRGVVATALGLSWLAVALHLAALMYEVGRTRTFPFSQGPLAFLAVVWLASLGYLLVQSRRPLGHLGAFILPVIFLLVAYAFYQFAFTPLADPGFRSFWLGAHVVTNMVGIASFLITFGGGLLYVLQVYRLKHKRFKKGGWQPPSLEKLDRLTVRAMVFGFPVLTLGILTGAVYYQSVRGVFWSFEDPISVWALITWVIFGILLQGRLTIGWRGRKASVVAIIGFCAVVFTFMAVFEGGHVFSSR